MYNPTEHSDFHYEDRRPRRSASPMASAALTCAILGILTSLTGLFSILFGSLAILLSALSRGANKKPERAARFALRGGVIALVLSVVVICVSVKTVLREYGSLENYYNTYVYTIEQLYGIDLDSTDTL